MHDWNHQSNFSSSPTKSNVTLQRKNQQDFFPGRKWARKKKFFLREKAYKCNIVLPCVPLTFTQTSTFDYLYGILNE